MTSLLDESDLLSRIRAGDQRAFEDLVRTHGPRMLAVARRFLHCDADAHDALQDAFVSAFSAVVDFSGQSRLATWLHRITVNACLMKLRSRSRRDEAPIDDLLPAFDAVGHRIVVAGRRANHIDSNCPSEYAAASERRQLVRDAIDRLPDSYRQILLLRDIEGLDTSETARLLNCSESNVKTRLHRARQALKTLLDPVLV